MLDPRRWHTSVRWIAIRIATLPVIFVVVSFASYAAVYGPFAYDHVGERCERLITGSSITPEACKAVREQLMLEGSWVVGYGDWLADAARGELGTSVELRRSNGEPQPHRDLILDRMSSTLRLLVYSTVLAVGLSVVLAYPTVRARGSIWDALARGATHLFIALPIFSIASFALMVPADVWGYLPPLLVEAPSLTEGPWNHARAYLLPTLIMALFSLGAAGGVARHGLSSRDRLSIARTGALIVSRVLPLLISALIVVEMVFVASGLGNIYVRSMMFRDLPTVHLLLSLALFLAVGARIFAPGIGHTYKTSGVTGDTRIEHGRVLIAAALVLLSFAILAALAPHVAPHDPWALGAGGVKENPSWAHPFGTDVYGRDMFSRVIAGARPSFTFGLSTVALGFVPGAVVAIAIARASTRVTLALGTIASVALAAPVLLFVLAAMRRDDGAVASAVGWTALFAAMFAMTVVARHSGSQHRPVRETVAMLAPFVCAAALRLFAAAVMLHAIVAWLGVDPYLGEPSWGADIERARQSFPYPYAVAVFPTLALMLLMLSCSVLADSVENTRRRESTQRVGQ